MDYPHLISTDSEFEKFVALLYTRIRNDDIMILDTGISYVIMHHLSYNVGNLYNEETFTIAVS